MSRVPYRIQQETACTYCSFRPVCQFDDAIEARISALGKPGKDQVWDMLGHPKGAGERDDSKTRGRCGCDDQWKAIALSGDDMLVAVRLVQGRPPCWLNGSFAKSSTIPRGSALTGFLWLHLQGGDAKCETDPGRLTVSWTGIRTMSMSGASSLWQGVDYNAHSFCMEVIRRYYQLIPWIGIPHPE